MARPSAGHHRAVSHRNPLPTRAALADALHRLRGAGIRLDAASDHGVSEALYLRDPDQNGVELYWDRQPADWPGDPDGGLAMFTRQLDLDDLLRHREVYSS